MCRDLTVDFFFMKAANIFERMEIAEYIYKGVVEPYH